MQDVEDLQKLLLQKHDAGMQKYKKKNNESQRTKFFLSAATS